jgi:hypothetical protein
MPSRYSSLYDDLPSGGRRIRDGQPRYGESGCYHRLSTYGRPNDSPESPYHIERQRRSRLRSRSPPSSDRYRGSHYGSPEPLNDPSYFRQRSRSPPVSSRYRKARYGMQDGYEAEADRPRRSRNPLNLLREQARSSPRRNGFSSTSSPAEEMAQGRYGDFTTERYANLSRYSAALGDYDQPAPMRRASTHRASRGDTLAAMFGRVDLNGVGRSSGGGDRLAEDVARMHLRRSGSRRSSRYQ